MKHINKKGVHHVTIQESVDECSEDTLREIIKKCCDMHGCCPEMLVHWVEWTNKQYGYYRKENK